MGGKSKTTQTTTNPQALSQFDAAKAKFENSSYSGISPDQIEKFQSPYRSSVIDATLARSNQNQQLAMNGNKDAAIKSGAFGGTGLNVQNALTAGQFDLNNQQTIAGLNDQNYSQALQTAQGENAAANQYPLAIQALLGQLAQGTTQTSTRTSPYDWAGTVSALGNAASGASSLFALSDARLKRDIVPLGERNGRKWYNFKYLWSDKVHEGVIAQENPDITIDGPGGYLVVNYGAL